MKEQTAESFEAQLKHSTPSPSPLPLAPYP